jgi:hypothetical protein
MNFGAIKSVYHLDIIIASIIGVISLIVFTVLYVVGKKKYFKNSKSRDVLPA